MQDVAKLAGVSVKTVSNVVNEFPHVRPETRKRVENAIEKLGYEVNFTARNLRRGRTGLIGLALPELKLPYFAELADSVIVEAEKAGLRVLIEQTNSDRNREIDVLHGPLRTMTDGTIFSPLALGPEDIRLFTVDFPLVLLGERVFGSPNDHITMSNVEAAAAATRHLIEQGRTRIAVVGAHPGEVVGSAALRERGFRRAMDEAGLPVREELIRPTGLWHRNTGAEATDELIESGAEFDGVVALNDTLALGVLHSLHSHRIDVPSQVAVIGFDDIEDAAFTRPTLSTVSPGRQQIARVAVAMLEDRVREAATPLKDRLPVRHLYADFTIVERESSGAKTPV
ncbi:LacI family DNA-binding transcriptional regulator [Tessaracoccus sp. ZS01]|uniref:LacI family DNA-binding transcriptional regulator n=1 Tax=Tessaracoccus sp. ZS01 TaxID=1906324 RepID=UPI00096BDEF7|nr:LacI family DNA-binding transcriptional regulator [Tessaracoccus sp. ZS01]MCG6567148.1 LacI family transcriptional regulator [Tessaracoccus sp. ZS01]OMG57550.1 LacI family transcriptional regulator [Tessaracoccus sp. ZS01]